jgi:hypothetical protein
VSIDTLTEFLEKTPSDLASAWCYNEATSLASRMVPEALLGDQAPLLRSDQYRLWLRWFLEGLISPQLVAMDSTQGKLEILSAAVKRIDQIYPSIDVDRRKRLAHAITSHVFDSVTTVRTPKARDFATPATRHILLASSPIARCYICGYPFCGDARDAFLKVKGRNPIQLPTLVDVLMPRGIVSRDVSIEIDHVVPVAAGGLGQANLRLACGWCNKYKSNRISIYESSFLAPRTTRFRIGKYQLNELPVPFWAIRILALRGKCQHVGGCSHTAETSQLYITFADWSGSPNPTNLTVFCETHDPIRVDRKQSRTIVQKLWSDKKS